MTDAEVQKFMEDEKRKADKAREEYELRHVPLFIDKKGNVRAVGKP